MAPADARLRGLGICEEKARTGKAGSGVCLGRRPRKRACRVAFPHRPGFASRSVPHLSAARPEKSPIGLFRSVSISGSFCSFGYPASGGSPPGCLSSAPCTRFADEPIFCSHGIAGTSTTALRSEGSRSVALKREIGFLCPVIATPAELMSIEP